MYTYKHTNTYVNTCAYMYANIWIVDRKRDYCGQRYSTGVRHLPSMWPTREGPS